MFTHLLFKNRKPPVFTLLNCKPTFHWIHPSIMHYLALLFIDSAHFTGQRQDDCSTPTSICCYILCIHSIEKILKPVQFGNNVSAEQTVLIHELEHSLTKRGELAYVCYFVLCLVFFSSGSMLRYSILFHYWLIHLFRLIVLMSFETESPS